MRSCAWGLRVRQFILPDDLVIVGATLPLIPSSRRRCPAAWDAQPPKAAAATIGDRFVRDGAAPAILVPSVVVPGDHNVLVNPAHPRFNEIVCDSRTAFNVDPRLGSRASRGH
jgi:hypothetical protein